MAAVARYRQAMREFAGMTNLDVWYAHADVDRAAGAVRLPAPSPAAQDAGQGPGQGADQGQHAGTGQADPDRSTAGRGSSPIRRCWSRSTSCCPRRRTGRTSKPQLKGLIAKYRRTLETDRRYLLEQFEFCDMARKVVGVGSVGTRCWIVLMLGRDESDPLFLQVKEAEASVLSRFVGASKYANQGQRVVAGQRLMQAASDIFLGWQRIEAGLDEPAAGLLRPAAAGLEILRRHRGSCVPRDCSCTAGLCGWTLARAHARSGDRIAIAAYLGGSDVFDRAIARFAAAYADQNERDYQALLDAVEVRADNRRARPVTRRGT